MDVCMGFTYWRDGWLMDRLDKQIAALTVIVLGGTAFLIYAAIAENRQWKAFAEAHNCKLVSVDHGDVIPTMVVANGQVITGVSSTSTKKGWLCDDGITYYRR